MTKRLWLTTTTGRRWSGQAICEALTDEEALRRLEAGEDLRPVQGEASLIAELAEEVPASA